MADEVRPPHPPAAHPVHRRRVALASVPATLGFLALGAAACGSSPTTPAASGGGAHGATTTTMPGPGAGSSTPTVKVATTSVGKILETASGMALYTYGPNHGGTQNTCTGACLQAWPALTVPEGSTPLAGPGVTGTLATATQSDGTEQVTYDGNLLYTFLSDQPGQVTGNGVAGFSVAKLTAGSSASRSATTTSGTTATTQASGGGGGGY